MTKKKPKFHNLCKDCIMKRYCQFKDKNNPEASVVGLFGNEGIGLECPEDLGGYPELAGLPPIEKKKRKSEDIEKEKNKISELKIIARGRDAYSPSRLKNKEKAKTKEDDDPPDKAFLKKIVDKDKK